MPTLEDYQAKSNIANRNLQESQQRVEEYKQNLSKIQTPRRSLQFQQQYIKGNRALAGRVESQIASAKQTREVGSREVEQYERQLAQEKQNLTQFNREIDAYKQLNKSVKKSLNIGRMSAKEIQRIEGAFQYAGLKPDEAIQTYKQAVNTGLGIPRQVKQETIGKNLNETIDISSLGLGSAPVTNYPTQTTTEYKQPTNVLDIQTQPYLTRFETGSIQSPTTGRNIPVYSDITYVDPFVSGMQFERSATSEEKQFYEKESKVQTDVTRMSSDKITGFGLYGLKAKDTFAGVKNTLYQANAGASEYISKGASKIGVSGTMFEDIAQVSSKTSPLGLIWPKAGKFVGGAVSGLVLSVKRKPVTYGSLYAISAGAGLAVESAPLITRGTLSLIPKYGTKIGTTTESILRTGTLLGGAGLTADYGYNKLKLMSVSNPKEAGAIFGESIVETSVFGSGFYRGSKLALTGQGILATRGMREWNIEKLTKPEVLSGDEPFLLAPKNKQLSLFKESPYNIPIEKLEGYSGKGKLIYSEEYSNLPFKVPAGGYHATPFQLPKEFTPTIGSSELSGTYIAPGASVYFTGIKGSSSGSRFNPMKWFKDITAARKPGIEFTQTKGFRVVGYRRSKGARPYEFIKPAKKGIADVPLMKKEAEAILRPESGKYGLIDSSGYVTLWGTRVPVRVFRYVEEGKTKSIIQPTGISTIPRASKFQPESYATSSRVSSIMKPYQYKESKVSRRISTPLSSALSKVSSGVSPTRTSSYKPSKQSRYNLSYKIKSQYPKPVRIIFSPIKDYTYHILSSTYRPRPNRPNPIVLPKLRYGEKYKQKRIRYLQPIRYQPSLTGSILDIRAKKQPKEILTGKGYLPTIRPVIDY